MEFSSNGYYLQNNEYQINLKSIIGQGNYGIVYDCIQIQNNHSQEQLCAKVWDVQQEYVEFAQRENNIHNIIKQKENPHLVKIYFSHFYEKSNKLIVVMEKCLESLKDEMQKEKYTLFNVEQIFHQILSGYKVLWENCIVHRDIKPDNILISKNGNMRVYKLADFGTGKICGKMDINMTKIGTPVYQAPECNPKIFDGELFDDFSNLKNQSFLKNWKSIVDVYSFGILAYQMIFSSFPFNTSSADGIIQFQQNLKSQKFKVPYNRSFGTTCNNNTILSLIENSIVYFPSQRVNFDKIFQIFFNKQILAPQKLFPKNFNPPNIQENLNFGKQPDNFQNNQERLCPPFQGQSFIGNNILQQNQAPNNNNFQNQFQNAGQSHPDFSQTKGIQNRQFQKPQQQQIVIDTKNDFKIYLNNQINQNSTLYGKPTITWFNQLIKLYDNKDSLLMQKNELLEVFLFKQSCSYSLEYLKFYYAMLYSLNSNNINNYHIQQTLDSESLLIQSILEIKKIII